MWIFMLFWLLCEWLVWMLFHILLSVIFVDAVVLNHKLSFFIEQCHVIVAISITSMQASIHASAQKDWYVTVTLDLFHH